MRAALETGGALFFEDLLARLRLLPSQSKRRSPSWPARGSPHATASRACARFLPAPGRAGVGRAKCGRREGRRRPLVLDRDPTRSAALPGAETGTGGGVEIEGGAEFAARVLLDRYGVVFRRLCTREPWLPPWRELVAVYRRREARGELRGGRFLALASGEQFALPEAVGLLREVRRRAKSLELVSLSAADPLNLAGIVTPGNSVPRGSGRVLYLDGVPIASQSGREVHMSEDLDRGAAWEARKALLRRGVGATRLSVAADATTAR